MQLSSYPRPSNDTGIGFHYFPDTQHYSRQALNHWLPELRAMGVSWLVLLATADAPVPELFLRELAGSGVEPVINLSVHPIRPVDRESLKEPLRYYASCGVHYLFAFAEPNVPQSWHPTDWARPDLVGRFVDLLCPLLEESLAAGLIPLLPPLVQGGYFWDTAFLAGELDAIVARGKKYLFDRLGVCFENLAFNRPISWGRGGQRRWTDSRPYQTAPAGEDNCGWCSFDWYDEIVRAKVGFSLPLLSIKGGAVLGDQSDKRFSVVDEAIHAERSVAVAMSLMDGEAPDFVLDHAFWIVGSGTNGEFEGAAWFKSDGRATPAVASLRDLAKRPRRGRAEKESAKQMRVYHKPIYHYVLFGRTERGIAEDEWQDAFGFIRRFRPTCGFSAEDAMNAEYVTIIGGPGEVSPQAERAVRAAGCKVERIAGDSRRDTKRMLNEMVAEGRRFRTLS